MPKQGAASWRTAGQASSQGPRVGLGQSAGMLADHGQPAWGWFDQPSIMCPAYWYA